MAEKKEVKKAASAGKKKTIQRWKMYSVSGGKLERKNKSCPKCGQGSYLAAHKDRITCGTCGYTEFSRKQ
ncbi:30S ribosomal protein S27ae [Candidatus Woesearchaeota archaeon]|nr:30S ribosomal protein S27ae [Candidatus Woesearchaeota archaeon]